jgi:type I restriction-modification system DNA methylase subunit
MCRARSSNLKGMPAQVEDALRELAARTGGATTADLDVPLSERVAGALGWQSRATRHERLTTSQGVLTVTQGYLGPRAAAIFVADGANAPQRLLRDAAQFAYHSSVQWGVVADVDRAVVFNSHWIRGEEWFRLPEIPWADFERHLSILTALSPSSVSAGELDRLATTISEPDRFLTPVDDALVDRLEHWRQQATRYVRDTAQIDEHLQTLFAQLFVLRAVQDRRLAPDLPSLEEALRPQESVDISRLRTLLDRARETIQSQLFATDLFETIPQFVLAGIIRDLYVPPLLPRGSRYNFAWIDADVLGRAYEKYLATVYVESPTPPQLHLFEQPAREVAPVSVRKAAGIFYTPDYLYGTLTDRAIDAVFAAHPDPDFIPRIADFACGSGSFLVEGVSVLLRRLRARNAHRNWARALVEGKHFVGIDVDYGAVTRTRLSLWIRLTDEPDALPLPSIDEVVVKGDSLGEEVWQTLPVSYDAVLGNPPFIATGGYQPREDLSRRFRSAQGRYDYAHLFLELAVNRLSPRGALGLVVPNRLFRNRDAGVVRGILTENTDLLAIYDFGANEVFKGTSAYIGALVASKKASKDAPHPNTVRVVLVSDISDTRYLGGLLVNATTGQGEYRHHAFSAFDIRHPSGSGGWVLLAPEVKRARVRLEESSVPLGSFAGVVQGIRTGANDVFIVRVESTDGSLSRVANGLGESAVVEASLLHPVIFGPDIQRYRPLRWSQMLLYPYRRGAVLSETELQDSYPGTYQYLSRYRDLLAARTSNTGRWYELVRQRDENWLSSSKLLSRDLASRTSFTIDSEGLYLVGGTAVIPPNSDAAFPLLAYLNSSTATEYLRELTPAFRGAFQKFEPQHLNQLPIPQFLADLGESAVRLGELAKQVLQSRTEGDDNGEHPAEREIDDIVASAVGVGSAY